ncbi:MAG: uroporphyrinogen decarboxylase family protein [Methanosphaera sp.]|uniref:uroporphyrinogen decarboxylase family protein n=1 Tax=Methanosphaera sp. TaxID=2666342 RepID=UPI0025E5480C|nr:uroporphyrinogen decarboxylase family protein [Methanosphaera sp.]MCI5867714.1 hypothetical protein [Methanosphaera sp.]MDD6535326.1 uroporphyrinogen decarboxylase family protein [Methanosphaera sp.]MDY3956488.1 uroporphyrinogen decarboxylase family protein [Methanosphaera sp.]
MTLREKFSDILDDKNNNEKTIVAPITTINLIKYRQNLDVQFPEAHLNVDDMVKLATAPYNTSKIEGINIPFDMTIESQSFGCEIDMRDGSNMPEVASSPFSKPEDIEIPENFTDSSRMKILFDAMDKINMQYPDVPLIVGVVGPFTLLGQLLGIEDLLKYIKTEYFEIEEAISVITEALIMFCEEIDKHNPSAICICEPSCSCDLLDPKIFKKLIKEEVEYIADSIQSHSILHVCGNSTEIIEDMLTCNYDAISIENIVDLDYVNEQRTKTQSKTKVCGNVSTKTLLLGDKTQINTEVKTALNKGIDIVASSCSVPPYTPEENVHEMIKARDEYYQQ